MINRNFLVMMLLLVATSIISQDLKILKGTTEFRKIVFDNYAVNLNQIEHIRQKLDSIGANDLEFIYFLNQLKYVTKNFYNEKLPGRKYSIENLKNNKIYQGLTDIESAILLDNTELIFIPYHGIWGSRYPHKIDVNSVRSKEIAHYGVETGDRILHYNAYNNHLCDVFFLAYDSVDITHHPETFNAKDRNLFQVVSSDEDRISSKLNYPVSESSKLDTDQKYDKIVFDALGIIHYSGQSKLKYQLKEIHKMLEEDGELIISGNYLRPPFDGPFAKIDSIDKNIDRVLKRGFQLKEKIYVENEFLIYKFVKKKE